jgi:two-component sensor histidine kinase
MAKALAEGRAENERWHVRRDGSRFWGSGVMLPLRGAAAGGFLKVMRDETARREGDERQSLLIRELAHRVKNSLALIMAMARQTGLSAADLDEFLGTFEGRLKALAGVHDLLSERGWRGPPLAALIRAALAPHEGRVRLGRMAELSLTPAAAQDLVLALHELATNAAKHGALSAPHGSVTLEGRVSDDELVLTWGEAGGPPAASPRHRGFGTTLLEQAVARQNKGRVGFDWRPEGLACTLVLPLAQVADRPPSQGPAPP